MTTGAGQASEWSVDVRRSLTFAFEDERWTRKLLIGALFALGPVLVIGIFFLIGYLIEIIRRVETGAEEPLPEWSGNYGRYFREGFTAAWGVLIWLLPFQVLWLGAALLIGGSHGLAIQVVFGIAMLVAVNAYAAAILPSVLGCYAEHRRFRSMFELRRIAASIRSIGRRFVAVWAVHLAVLGLTFVTIWTIVAIIFTTAYAAMVLGHAYGQALRSARPRAPASARS